MATETYLGELNKLQKSSARNNKWARRANVNFMKIGVAMNLSCISKVTPLPVYERVEDEPPEGTTYVNPDNQRLYVWTEAWDDGEGDPFPKGWAVFQPSYGNIMFVEDEETLCIFSKSTEAWEVLVDLNEQHVATPRELSFFAPGIVRPKSIIFHYVAGMEFTLPAGAPDSGASLQTAPSSDIEFQILKGNTVIGGIYFGAGSTAGVVSVPDETVINPALPEETQYVRANVLQVRSPDSVAGAMGLDVTLRGKIRAID